MSEPDQAPSTHTTRRVPRRTLIVLILLAFGGDHHVDGQSPVDRDDRLERIEECALRSLLVGCAASHETASVNRSYP